MAVTAAEMVVLIDEAIAGLLTGELAGAQTIKAGDDLITFSDLGELRLMRKHYAELASAETRATARSGPFARQYAFRPQEPGGDSA